MTSITELWGLTPYRPGAGATPVAVSNPGERGGLLLDNLLAIRAVAHDMARIGLQVPTAEKAFLTEGVESMYRYYSQTVVPPLEQILRARGGMIPPFPPYAASWYEEATMVDGDALRGALLPYITAPHMKELVLNLGRLDGGRVHWTSRACSHIVILDLFVDSLRTVQSGRNDDQGAMAFARLLLAEPMLKPYADAILSPHMQHVSARANALLVEMRSRPLETGWHDSEAREATRILKGPPLAMYAV